MNRRPPLVLCLFAFAPAVASASVRPSFGGRVTVAVAGPLRSHNPVLARTDAERMLAQSLHCALPELLAAVPQKQGQGFYELRLFANLVFHDGTSLRASDVVRSLRRYADPSTGAVAAWRLLGIAGAADRLAGGNAPLGVRATGPHTLEIETAFEHVDLVRWLDDARLPILKADGVTGCGPFVRSDAPAGQPGIWLRPFDRHPQGRPYLDRLTIIPVASDAARAGTAGTADVVVGALARRRGRAVGPPRHATFAVVNGDPAIRQLLEASIDRDALVHFLVGGGAQSMTSLLPPSSSKSAAPAVPASLPRTRLPRLTLAFDQGQPIHRLVAERIQVRLHDAGAEVILTPLRGPTAADLSSGAHAISLVQLSALPSDPALALVAVVHALAGPKEAAATMKAALETDGHPVRLQHLADRLTRSLPVVPLYIERDHVRVNDRVLGAHEARGVAVDPADLWRWPFPSLPKDQ